jgi:peptide-methionine (S)-S-oxide reductase
MKHALVRVLVALIVLASGAAMTSAAQAQPTQTAILAGGCFWCMESDMKAVPGVVSVESGYTGGKLANPTYKQVLTEKTGHYEAVRVRFDPRRITYRRLLDRYWKLVDPTDIGGQFCDRGASYRPAVFVQGAAQRKTAEASRLAASRQLKVGRMQTPILPAAPFYLAEAYHRDFARRNASSYKMYRVGCGRDMRLSQVWGAAG